MVKHFLLGLCLLTILIFPAVCEENLSLEEYFAFPLSIGVDAQSALSPREFDEDYRFFAYHLEANLKVPLFFNHHLRALVMGGFQQYLGSAMDTSPFSDHHYDYFQLYTGAGAELAWFFTKNWEAGITAFGGVGVATFPYIIEDKSRSSYNIMSEAEFYFAYNPSYNISLRLSPSLRYQQTWGGLNTFDGFTFGIGGALDFRMGDDPELVQRIIRSLNFSDTQVNDVFPAIQASYREKPFASLTIENREDYPLTDLKVYFNQPGFMDNPTPCQVPEKIAPGQKARLDIRANFNQQVFNTQGTQALTGEIIAEYKVRGRSARQRFPLIYNLHDVTAIQWDDDRKVAAFINSSNSLVSHFMNQVEKEIRPRVNPYLSAAMQKAMAFYGALQQEGCFYQSDPLSPFSSVKNDTFAVDKVYLPQETLRRASGDCDDLTVLYCSLLESAGIETGFITTPDHILPMFNSGVHPRDSKEIFPDRKRFIIIEDSLWIPVEITMIEKSSFDSAWAKASELFHQSDTTFSGRKLFVTREAQRHFQPLGQMSQSSPSLNFNIMPDKALADQLSILGKTAAALYSQGLGPETDARDWNRLGILQARYSLWQEAESSFQKAIEVQVNYLPALVNLGNLAFLAQDFSLAADFYTQVLNSSENHSLVTSISNREQQNLLYKLALCRREQGLLQEAQELLTQAENFNASTTDEISLFQLNPGQLKSGSPIAYEPFLDMWE